MSGTQAHRIVERGSRLLSRTLVPIRVLRGGEHATTVLALDERSEVVLRAFPPGDLAVERELQVLERLTSLGSLVPRLVAHTPRGEDPAVIITTKVDGEHPSPDLALDVIAMQMAGTLALIHQQGGVGLRLAPEAPPVGDHRVTLAARRGWSHLITEPRVLSHYDYWCGNALWSGERLTGVVDWSGARYAPRGLDAAWCRQDLVLMGSVAAADVFLERYETIAGTRIPTIRDWDLNAAAQAIAPVEEWSANYHAIGRTGLTPDTLRNRLETWTDHLLSSL